MNKATLRSREQLLKFVYGFGKKLKTPPVMFDDRSRRGVIPPSVVEYNLNRLVRYGLLVREPDGWVVPEDVSQRQMPPRIGARDIVTYRYSYASLGLGSFIPGI